MVLYPIYDIVRMCMPNSHLFQHPQVYDKPPFLKKKVYEWPDFWNWNCPNVLTSMYMHIFFTQITVNPLFSHLHKAGVLVMRSFENLFTNHRGNERVYKFKEQYMNRSTFCEIKYMKRLFFFSKNRVYDSCWFQNTDSHTRIKITPAPPSHTITEDMKGYKIQRTVNG